MVNRDRQQRTENGKEGEVRQERRNAVRTIGEHERHGILAGRRWADVRIKLMQPMSSIVEERRNGMRGTWRVRGKKEAIDERLACKEW